MEIILPSRNKIVAVIPLLIVLISSAYLFLIFGNEQSGDDEISAFISKIVDKTEKKIKNRSKKFDIRSEELFKSIEPGNSDVSLNPGEALVFEKDGKVKKYLGEIFYFKNRDIAPGSFLFLKKESKIYFLKKLDNHTFYVNKFFDLGKGFFGLKKALPFIFYEVKFFDSPVRKLEKSSFAGIKRENYYFYKNLDSMNNQVFLTIKFLRADFNRFYKMRVESVWLFVLLLFSGFFYMYLRIKHLFPLLKAIYFLLFSIFFILFVLRLSNCISISEFINNGFGIYHLAMLLFISLITFFIPGLVKKLSGLKYLIFCILTALIYTLPGIFGIILDNLSFPYLDISFFTPSILMLVFMFLLFRSLFISLESSVSKKTKKGVNRLEIPIIFFGIIFFILYPSYIPVNILLMVSMLITIRSGGSFGFEILKILLISAAVFLVIFNKGSSEKREFISHGLRDIFSNQNNYAKFISREIIHNFNRRSSDLSIFFKPDISRELRSIWRSSIAAKENISSGIYIVDPKNELINSFSYRIPYLNIEIKKKFPFWEIDEYKTIYYGNRVSLAVAYINVFKDFKYLGKIVIQVIDSSDLIVKDRNENSIFMLNRRVNGNDLSYIKLNRDNRIIENPSNITLHDISGMIKSAPGWIEFKSMDLIYRGFIFKSNENTIIIFYPMQTITDITSEIVRLFLLFLLINVFIYIREIVSLEWRNIFRSFSFQVFAILILLSLVTATIFSLISIQYNRGSSAQSYRNRIYAADDIAFKIISDIISKNETLVQNDLFFLSNILDSDVSIYLKKELTETSNFKKILESKIPLFVNSGIAKNLLLKNERFIVSNSGGNYSSYFKIYDYIVRIDHPFRTGIDILQRRLFLNFIVNLFFILTLFGIFLAIIFRKRILFPIRTLNLKMSNVEQGNLKPIKAIPKEIEIKSLFSGFNSMVKGISSQKKKISEISRMKILVKISRWIAHEVKNPLTPIKLSAEQILRSLKDKRSGYENIIRESVNYIITETEHLENISHGFLNFSNLNELIREKFDIVELCRDEVGKLEKIFKNINFILDSHDKKMIVNMDKVKVRQVLKNILTNSIEAIKKGSGKISVTLRRENGVIIEVEDTGIGLMNVEGKDLFSEDFSSKEKGTGLGLFIVKRVVELHGGTVEIGTKKSGSTLVKVSLPYSQKQQGDQKSG